MKWKLSAIAAMMPLVGFAMAQTEEKAKETPAPTAERFEVDAVHSTVLFRIKHMNVSYSYGRFNDIKGEFTFDPTNMDKCDIDISLKTESVDTANKKRDEHLRGPDFFNAKQFPTMQFKSKTFKKISENKFEVAGHLSLHGVKKPVTAIIDRTGSAPGWGGGRIAGFETSLTIKRSDFGMGNMLESLGDEVRITVSIEGSHK